jgi:hypothetical protein
VDPFYKTASEVVTLAYIREHTSIPVPHVVMHDSTADNKLGLGWMLVERILGAPLGTIWGEMDMEAKEREVRVVVQHVKQLRVQCSLDATGNLYFGEDPLGENYACDTYGR